VAKFVSSTAMPMMMGERPSESEMR